MLWNANGIEYDGHRYSQDMIRHMMLNNMVPEELDEAIRCWKEQGESGVEQLCHILFVTVVLDNALDLYYQVLKGESGWIACECKLNVEIVA